MNARTKRLNIAVSAQAHEWLLSEADRTGLSCAQVIDMLLRQCAARKTCLSLDVGLGWDTNARRYSRHTTLTSGA